MPESLRRQIDSFDDLVDEALDRWRGHRAMDRLFYSASALGDHSLVWLMLGAVRGLRSEHNWKAAVRVGAALGAESALVNLGIKSLFHRTRPTSQQPRPLQVRQPRTSSFPSGHGTSAFMAADLLSQDDAAWPLYYALAAVVATSRVYVRIHHASDVAGGVLIGILLGRLARHLVPLQPPA